MRYAVNQLATKPTGCPTQNDSRLDSFSDSLTSGQTQGKSTQVYLFLLVMAGKILGLLEKFYIYFTHQMPHNVGVFHLRASKDPRRILDSRLYFYCGYPDPVRYERRGRFEANWQTI